MNLMHFVRSDGFIRVDRLFFLAIFNFSGTVLRGQPFFAVIASNGVPESQIGLFVSKIPLRRQQAKH